MEKQTNIDLSKVNLRSCLKDGKVLFASCLGVGFAKKAPGTFGSIFALPFLYVFDMLAAPKFMLWPFLIMLTVISSFICQVIMNQYELDDPGWVVIDEFLGMLLGYLLYPSRNVLALVLLFGLFRVFDIFKPFPISLADKMKSGFGIILDDLIAGLFAGLILLGLNHFQILI
jgi:phosphatidylglycerophosphatase A